MTREGIGISVGSRPLLMPFAWKTDSLLSRKAPKTTIARAMKETLKPFNRKSLTTLRAARTAEQLRLASSKTTPLHLSTNMTRWTRQRSSTQKTLSSQTKALSALKCSRQKTLQLRKSNTTGNPINQSLPSPKIQKRDCCRKETQITSQEVKF